MLLQILQLNLLASSTVVALLDGLFLCRQEFWADEKSSDWRARMSYSSLTSPSAASKHPVRSFKPLLPPHCCLLPVQPLTPVIPCHATQLRSSLNDIIFTATLISIMAEMTGE